jgi:hypothetical protein
LARHHRFHEFDERGKLRSTWLRSIFGPRRPAFLFVATPVGSRRGIICTGESYARRAIDIQEREEVDAAAFQELVHQAIAFNGVGTAKTSKKMP